MAKRRAPKGKPHFLAKGESLRIIGVKGKPVKRTRPGREYVLAVIKNRKVERYINSVDKKTRKPVPRQFTNSMIARLKYSKRQKITRRGKAGGTYKIHNKDFIKNQISDKMLREIRRNRGKAFHLKVKFGRQTLPTHSFYQKRMGSEALRNLITSDLLYILGRYKYRMSPKLEGTEDKKGTKRIEEAQLELNFTEIEGHGNGQRKNAGARRRSGRTSPGKRGSK